MVYISTFFSHPLAQTTLITKFSQDSSQRRTKWQTQIRINVATFQRQMNERKKEVKGQYVGGWGGEWGQKPNQTVGGNGNKMMVCHMARLWSLIQINRTGKFPISTINFLWFEVNINYIHICVFWNGKGDKPISYYVQHMYAQL